MKHRTLLESDAGRAALQGLCPAYKVSPAIAAKLVAAVESQAGRARRHGLFDRLDEILTEDDAA